MDHLDYDAYRQLPPSARLWLRASHARDTGLPRLIIWAFLDFWIVALLLSCAGVWGSGLLGAYEQVQVPLESPSESQARAFLALAGGPHLATFEQATRDARAAKRAASLVNAKEVVAWRGLSAPAGWIGSALAQQGADPERLRAMGAAWIAFRDASLASLPAPTRCDLPHAIGSFWIRSALGDPACAAAAEEPPGPVLIFGFAAWATLLGAICLAAEAVGRLDAFVDALCALSGMPALFLWIRDFWHSSFPDWMSGNKERSLAAFEAARLRLATFAPRLRRSSRPARRL